MKNSGENSGKKTMPEGKRWKKGESGNPKGRPHSGESWKDIVRTVADMDIDGVLSVIGDDNETGKAIAKMPRHVQIKYLVVVRVFAMLLTDFYPSAALFRELMDRADGKVREQPTRRETLTDGERWEQISQIIEKAYARKEAAEGGEPGQRQTPWR